MEQISAPLVEDNAARQATSQAMLPAAGAHEVVVLIVEDLIEGGRRALQRGRELLERGLPRLHR